MMNLLFRQFFDADGEIGGGNPAPNNQGSNQQINIDYDRLADSISSRLNRAEDGALKGLLKEQGLKDEEVDEAIKQYKENQKTKAKEEQERIDKILAENKVYKEKEVRAQIDSKAKNIAKELGVRDDRVDALIRLSDSSKFTDDKGIINDEGIKKELEEQLKNVPEFKAKSNIHVTSGKTEIKPNEQSEDDEYMQRKYGKNKYFRGVK